MGKGLVYIITNLVDGKIYIGCTTGRLCSRKCRHKNNAFVGKSKSALYEDMRRLGWESFRFKVLEEAEVDKLAELEKSWIATFRIVLGNELVYNIKDGGQSLRQTSQETKDKIREYRKGKVHSQETKQLMSVAKTGIPRKSNGWKPTPMHLEAMRIGRAKSQADKKSIKEGK